MAARKKARATPQTRRGAKLKAPEWTGWEEMPGDEYARFRQGTHRWYYDNFQPADLMPAVWSWMETNGYGKEDIPNARLLLPIRLVLLRQSCVTCSMPVCQTLIPSMMNIGKRSLEPWGT